MDAFSQIIAELFLFLIKTVILIVRLLSRLFRYLFSRNSN